MIIVSNSYTKLLSLSDAYALNYGFAFLLFSMMYFFSIANQGEQGLLTPQSSWTQNTWSFRWHALC